MDEKCVVVVVENSPAITQDSPDKKPLDSIDSKSPNKNNSAPWSKLWHVYSYVILGGCDTIIYKY